MKPRIGNVVTIDGRYGVVFSDYGTGLSGVYFNGEQFILVHGENPEIVCENLEEFCSIAFGYDGDYPC
jgi:hypothetical protein